MNSRSQSPDVIIIGAGIAGLAAAHRLKEHGRTPLVLEKEDRVGGRMTTDRIDGFIIDRGATLLGNRFGHMRSLCRQLGLGPRMQASRFSFGLQENDGIFGFRAGRVDDILGSALLSGRGKAAFLRLAVDILVNRNALTHGRSDLSEAIDDSSVLDYLRKFGSGGIELFDKLLQPGLRGPVGGHLPDISRAILLQTAWNLLVWGSWILDDGLDRLPETLALDIDVCKGVLVKRVMRQGDHMVVEAKGADSMPLTFEARAVILAVPGHLVPKLVSDLPVWLSKPLESTEYSTMVSVHIATDIRPRCPYSGYSFASGIQEGVEIELEHVRMPASCPEGKGLISLYFYPCELTPYQRMSNQELSPAAVRIVEETFPELRGKTIFTHIVRWPAGIAQFPPGRLTEMAQLRHRLVAFEEPMDFCGDYWDGLSTEGALRTGQQAADRLLKRFPLSA